MYTMQLYSVITTIKFTLNYGTAVYNDLEYVYIIKMQSKVLTYTNRIDVNAQVVCD